MSEIPGQVELSSIKPLGDLFELEGLLELAIKVYVSMSLDQLSRIKEVIEESGQPPSIPLQLALFFRGLTNEHGN